MWAVRWRGVWAWPCWAAGAWWLQQALLAHLPAWLAAAVLALLLKPLLAWRMLRDEVLAVEDALATSLDAGRQRLSRIVSRDTRALTETEVRESAIETLAENLNDSVVAPVFWFVLLGLPGAVVYRFANTADAMWGYRGRWEWAGKFAARADDVLSWIPARITALLLVVVAPRIGLVFVACGGPPHAIAQQWLADGGHGAGAAGAPGQARRLCAQCTGQGARGCRHCCSPHLCIKIGAGQRFFWRCCYAFYTNVGAVEWLTP